MRYVLAIMLAFLTLARAEAQPLHAGVWQGQLDTGAVQLRLELHVVANDDGGLDIRLVSLDQGGATMPATLTVSTENLLQLDIPSLSARYEAQWLEADALNGTFTQNGVSLALDFVPGAFPALPAAAADPNDEALTVMSGDVRLTGSLRRPAMPGPAPALVMLSGSGAQDRDFTLGDQKVFANIAGALAGTGVASLRLDDRGVGESDPTAPLSPAVLAADAAAAIEVLRAQPGINPACVGILGHSEGGMIAFLAAPMASPDFILTLSGMNASLADTLVEQGEVMARASGGGDEEVAAQLGLQTALFEAMRSATPDTAGEVIRAALSEAGLADAIAAQQAAIWGQPYALAALDLDPSDAIHAYPGPVTAVFGTLDVQVPAEPASRRLRDQRGEQPLAVVIIPGVNHVYQEAASGLPAEYARAGAAPSAPALAAIADAVGRLTESCRDH